MITVDCGIADHGWAQRIEEQTDCKVIITDHHLPQGELPNCHAVVNPNQPDCSYPDKGPGWGRCGLETGLGNRL